MATTPNNKMRIKSRKNGFEQNVTPEVYNSLVELNGKHAYTVLKDNTTPPEALEPTTEASTKKTATTK